MNNGPIFLKLLCQSVKWRNPDTAADEKDVLPFFLGNREPVAERSKDVNTLPVIPRRQPVGAFPLRTVNDRDDAFLYLPGSNANRTSKQCFPSVTAADVHELSGGFYLLCRYTV